MTKRNIKQIIIALIFFSILFGFGFLIYSISIKPDPSCEDGIKNQKEEGIDCGGPCLPCPAEIHQREVRVAGKCPDKRCTLDEIFTCWADCYLFWIITLISLIMVILLIFLIKRKLLKNEEPEGEKKSIKHRKLI